MTNANSTKKEPCARVFNIAQYEVNPVSGENLNFGESVIQEALQHKSIKQWAYVCHDQDVSDDGNLKPRHWHVVLSVSPALPLSVIAKWFNVAPNFIQIPKGRDAFIDCITYLTHELVEGKHRYPDEAVKANFNFRELIAARAERIIKYHSADLNPQDQQRYDVLIYGKTLRQCKLDDPLLFARDLPLLKRLRGEYLASLRPPSVRTNFYIEGRGGAGKGAMSRALARVLCPGLCDQETFFPVGARNTTFEGYDGQPVLLWHDHRAIDLLDRFSDRGQLFNFFDQHPDFRQENVKFSSISVPATINIVNSVEPYKEFLDGLAGEYTNRQGVKIKSELEKKEQSYRRFPFIIRVYEDSYDLLVNSKAANPTSGLGYFSFCEYAHIRGSIVEVVKAFSSVQEELIKYEAKLLRIVKNEYEEYLEALECLKDMEYDFDNLGSFDAKKNVITLK